MKKIFRLSSIIMIGDMSARAISILYLVPLMAINSNIAALITEFIIPFAFFIVLANMGISTVLTVRIVKYKDADPSLAKTSVIIATATLIITSFILTCVMFFFAEPLVSNYLTNGVNNPGYQDVVHATKILSAGVLLYGLLSISRTLIIANGDYVIISVGYILEQLVKVFIILIMSYIFLVKRGDAYFEIVYFVAIGNLLSMAIVLFINCIKIFRMKYYDIYLKGQAKITIAAIKSLLFASLIFIASSIYISAFDMIDMFFFDDIMRHLEVAPNVAQSIRAEYFGMAKKLVLLPIQLTDSFILVMIKELEFSSNKKKAFNDVLVLTITLSLIAISGLIVVGDDFYHLLAHIDSVGVLKVLALVIIFYTTKNIISAYILTFEGFEKALISSMVVILITKVVILFTCVDFFGMNVLIMSSIIALLAGIITLVIVGRRFISFDLSFYKAIIKNTIKILIITVVFEFININFSLFNNIMDQFIIGIAMIIAFVLFIIPKEELTKLLRRRRD